MKTAWRAMGVGLLLWSMTTSCFALSKFITIADIHFDPMASCEKAAKPCAILTKLRKSPTSEWASIFVKYDDKQLAGYQHDTNYALLKSSLDELKVVSQKEHPNFILLLGDFIGHNFRDEYRLYSGDKTAAGYRDFVRKILQFMTDAIRQAAPGVEMYPVIGNNDSYTGDYEVVPHGRFLEDAANTWLPLITDKENRKQFHAAFSQGGYYDVGVPHHPNQRIIVLNTVLFSTNSQAVAAQAAAHAELAWLHGRLAAATKQHQKVLLAFHIPTGIDVYGTIKNVFSSILEFWQPAYNMAFQNELNQFPETVTGILPAHIHVDGFQWLMFNGVKEIPVSLTPSISPIFGNNPAFKVYTYDANTLRLIHFDTYSYPLNNSGPSASWQKEHRKI